MSSNFHVSTCSVLVCTSLSTAQVEKDENMFYLCASKAQRRIKTPYAHVLVSIFIRSLGDPLILNGRNGRLANNFIKKILQYD